MVDDLVLTMLNTIFVVSSSTWCIEKTMGCGVVNYPEVGCGYLLQLAWSR
jgi:hypothetical protein